MSMIHVAKRHETMQRCIDRGSSRIKIKGAVWVCRDHRIFQRSLGALLVRSFVACAETLELTHIEARKILSLRGAEIATRAFDPEHLHFFSTERVCLHQFVGSISSTG